MVRTLKLLLRNMKENQLNNGKEERKQEEPQHKYRNLVYDTGDISTIKGKDRCFNNPTRTIHYPYGKKILNSYNVPFSKFSFRGIKR